MPPPGLRAPQPGRALTAPAAGFHAAAGATVRAAGGTGGASGDEAQFAGPGRGLGAVSRAKRAQDVAHMLLTVSRVTANSRAIAWFDRPPPASAARGRSAVNDAGGAGIRRRRPGGEGTLEPGQVTEGDARGRLAGSLALDKPAEQGERLPGRSRASTIRAAPGARARACSPAPGRCWTRSPLSRGLQPRETMAGRDDTLVPGRRGRFHPACPLSGDAMPRAAS